MHFCNMDKLNFPELKFSIKIKENKPYIFDPIRKKWVVLTPEEWVRQHCIKFLVKIKNIPVGLIQVEKKLNLNRVLKRYDIVVYKRNKTIAILIECKAPSIQLTQKTFDQIARYNILLKSEYLMLTNGINHFFCQMDYEKGKYLFLPDLPINIFSE